MVGNAKKWKEGTISLETVLKGIKVTLVALIREQTDDSFTIQFTWDVPGLTFGEIIEDAGSTPIPPYLNREAEESDRERYQTIYSHHPGSVAAPTAGLHFTDEMLTRLRQFGKRTAELTLHVGAGTFVPVKERDARNHHMHAEWVVISPSFLEQWAAQPDNLIAVGTTSTRSLESLYWLGVKVLSDASMSPVDLLIDQWDHEALPGSYTLAQSLEALIHFCHRHRLDQLHFSTRMMIIPGYKFRTLSGLITNFHLPGSTLLLLIAAFIGEDWRKVYDYALQNRFRFLSYGDSSLLLPR